LRRLEWAEWERSIGLAIARLGRDVAVKVLAERFADSAELRTRFERETRAAAALSIARIKTKQLR